MSPKLLLLLLLVPVAGPLFSQTAAERSDIEKSILALNAEMTRAAEARDIDRLFTFILPNDRGSIAQNGLLFASRDEARESVKRGFAAIQKVEYRWKRQMVTVLSPDTALLVADGETEAVFADGAAVVAPFAQTVLFIRRNNEWKVLHSHRSTPPR